MDETRSRLRRHSLFRALPEEALESLVAQSTSTRFTAGDVLLEQGEASDSAIIVLDGELDVVARMATGPVKLARVGGMALLGEIGVLADLPRTATVEAVSDGRLLTIGKDAFSRLADENPAILRYVVSRLGDQIGAFNRAVAVYTNALAALEREEFEADMLEHLNNPSPELMNFAATFRRMADQIVLKQRHREEMASATAIQRAMLPDPLPVDPSGRAALFAAMRPAREVGGDFYDAFQLDEDRLAVSVGDVSGKGVPAALFMAVCQTTIRVALREHGDDIARAVGHANDLLEAENKASMFATFFGAIVDLRTGRTRFCNCGHNEPALRRADGRLELLSTSGMALGMMGGATFESAEVTLGAGDRLLLYTDGLTEAHDPRGELFGDERLVEAVAQHGAGVFADLVPAIFSDVDAFTAGAAQHDDLTCIALGFSGGR